MKTYQIPVDDYFVLIEVPEVGEDSNIRDGFVLLYTKRVVKSKKDGRGIFVYETPSGIDMDFQSNLDYYIIAQSAHKHEGLPLFEPVGVDEAKILSNKIFAIHEDYPQIKKNELVDKQFALEFGYNKAKEKYEFTEEDLINALDLLVVKIKQGYLENHYWLRALHEILNEIRKPKIYEVVLEMEYYRYTSGGLRQIGEIGGKGLQTHEGTTPKLTNGKYTIISYTKATL